MIIRRNFNLYPELYEHSIMKISGVREALILGVYDEVLHDEKVYLILDADSDEKTMMSKLNAGRHSIDREALPDKIIFGEIPHSGRQNKADRAAALRMISGK